MVKDKVTPAEMIDATTKPRWDSIALPILTLLGSLLAVSMAVVDAAHANMPCTASGGCEAVANSQYAHISIGAASIPVAGLGALTYILLCSAAGLRLLPFRTLSRATGLFLASVSGLATLYSWYLQYIAHFKIHAFCPWCFTSACLMTAICALSISAVRNPDPFTGRDLTVDGNARQRRRATGSIVRMTALAHVAVLAVVGLAGFGIYKKAKTEAATVLQAPTLGGKVKSTASTVSSGGQSDMPTSIDIDFPTWVSLLQHTDSQIRGPIRAPYTFIEIGDFECKSCALVRNTLEDVVKQYKVNMFFINMPLPIHPHARVASEAAFAAAAQGKFWKMYDVLYNHRAALEPSHFGKYAAEAGCDGDQVAAAIAAHKYAPRSTRRSHSVAISRSPPRRRSSSTTTSPATLPWPWAVSRSTPRSRRPTGAPTTTST